MKFQYMVVFNFVQGGESGLGREFVEVKANIDNERIIRSVEKALCDCNGFDQVVITDWKELDESRIITDIN